MITKNDKIKCDTCGRFIGYKELASGKATNIMVTPESPISYEWYESTCKICREKENGYKKSLETVGHG